MFENVEERYDVKVLPERSRAHVELIELFEAVLFRVQETVLMNLADGQIAIAVLKKGPCRVARPGANLQNVFRFRHMSGERPEDDLHTVSEPWVLPFMSVQCVQTLRLVIFMIAGDLGVEENDALFP